MGGEAIVERARLMGISLSAHGNKIRYSPKSRTPEDLVMELRENKEDVLTYLREQSEPAILPNFLAWASRLAEDNIVLREPVSFSEGQLTTVTTCHVSRYAARCLSTISYARVQREHQGWRIFGPLWWHDRECEAVIALKNLRKVLCEQGETE